MQAHEVTADALAGAYGTAWSAFVDGVPIACAGVVEVWAGRAYAWALLADRAGPHLLWLTREIRFRLDSLALRRVEMAVDAGFGAGARWARMLGFVCETPEPARCYLPNGRDAWLFARVNNGDGNACGLGSGLRCGVDLCGQRAGGAGDGGG